MANIHRFASRSLSQTAIRRVVGQDTYNQFHPIGTALVQQDNAAKAAEQAATDAANQPAIPLPDEEQLARIRRRRAQRYSGRDSTVLTGASDTFGPSS